MRFLVAALILCILAGAARAEDAEPERTFRWTKLDTALELAVVTSLAVDYLQTRKLTEAGLESNRFLGRGRVSPEAWFLTAAASHVVVSLVIPEGRWRTAFQGIVLGAEFAAIENNWTAGYGLTF
jgi:hypothetical protein